MTQSLGHSAEQRLSNIVNRFRLDAERIRCLHYLLREDEGWKAFEAAAPWRSSRQISQSRRDIANQLVVMAVSCLDVAAKDIRMTLLTSYLLLEYRPEKFKVSIPANVARIAVEESLSGQKWEGYGQGFVLAEDKLRRELSRENFQGWENLVKGFKQVGISVDDLITREPLCSVATSQLGAQGNIRHALIECIGVVAQRRHEIVHRLGYSPTQLNDRQEPIPFEHVDQFLTVAGALVETAIGHATERFNQS